MCISRTFRAKIALKHRCERDVIILAYDFTDKEAQNWHKKCMYVCNTVLSGKLWNCFMYLHKALVRHTLQPLCDLSANKIHNDRRGRKGVAARFCSWSATGRRLIGDWSPTDRRLVGDLVGTSMRLDATSRRPVGDRSPTYRRPVADQVNLKVW